MALFRLLLVIGACLPCHRLLGQDDLAALRGMGARVAPVSAGSDGWDVDFHLGGQQVGDQDLFRLASLDAVLRLNLGSTRVTDDGLALVGTLDRLQRLDLSRTAIQGPGLAHLSGLRRLEHLNLYGSQVDDASLKHLERLPALRKVFLWQTRVTPEGAARLLAANPELQVNLGAGVTVAPPVPTRLFSPERTAQARTLLEEAGTPVQILAQDGPACRVDFHLKPAAARSETLAALLEIPDLVEVHLGGTEVGDEAPDVLGRIESLEILNLAGTGVSDAGLEHLVRLRHLHTLNLHSTVVSDAGLVHLRTLPSLRRLFVWNTKVSAEGAARLAAEHPGLTVQQGWDGKNPAEK